jgi:predicted GNAT superfamily acetyltransferase
MSINYRPLDTLEDFTSVEEIQNQVWAGADDPVPAALLSVIAHNGGCLIGAFDGEQMIGFVFSFLGTDETNSDRPAMTNLKHCSHMLAVLPEYRDQHIGYQLKLQQREFVVRQGVRLMTWTFDPLESRNAYLNIARLGCVVRKYKPNAYGNMTDALNAGLPSDRLIAEWWLTSNRVRERLGGGRAALNMESYTSAGVEILNPAAVSADGLLYPAEAARAPNGTFALVEIPYNMQAIRVYDLKLGGAWRYHIREVLAEALSQGYLITDFFSASREGRLRSYYALSYGDIRVE